MATVHCPQCRRALNLPDDRDVEVVCCPLCRHAFTPPAVPRVVAAPLPVPTQRIEPSFPSPAEAPRPLSFEPLDDEDYLPLRNRSEVRLALESASGWLRAMGWIGLMSTLPCCGTTALFMADRARLPEAFVAVLCGLVGAYAWVLFGAPCLQRQSNYRLAVACVAVALTTTSGLTLLVLPAVLSQFDLWPRSSVPFFGDNCCGFFLFFPSLAVILCGLVGGLKGLFALLRPGTRDLFHRPKDWGA